MSDLGTYLRKSRIAKNLSQAEVAAKLHYTTPQFVSNWERGLSSPPIKALKILIKALDLNVNKMIDILITDARREVERKFYRGG